MLNILYMLTDYLPKLTALILVAESGMEHGSLTSHSSTF